MPSESNGLVFSIRIDDQAILGALVAQRREISKDIMKVTAAAARDTVLPSARALAIPTRLKRTIIAGSNKRGAFITTNAKGMNRRILGLLNYGGVVGTPIFPVFARALRVAPDVWRASVLTPRFYKRHQFLEKSVEANLTRFSDQVARDMARIIQSRMQYASTFGTFGRSSSNLSLAG